MSTMTLRMLPLIGFLLLAFGVAQAQPAATAEEETRADQLDRLFMELAEAPADGSERVANRIRAVMSQSGSATADLLLQRALRASDEGRDDHARQHLNALTRLAPGFAEGWNASATQHFANQRFGAAVADIERALALEPRHFAAMAGLAVIMEETENQARALEAWRGVAALYPGFEAAQSAIERLEPLVEGDDI